MPHHLQRPPLTATILTLIGIAVLCGLGYWQMQRLAWKEALLSAIAQESAKPAAPLTDFSLSDTQPIKRGTITGRTLHRPPIKIAPRTLEGKKGAHIYTAFMRQDGRVIFINHGWAAEEWQASSAKTNAAQQTLTGFLTQPPRANLFTPENMPDKNQWYHADPLEMAEALNIKTAPSARIFILQNQALKGVTPLNPSKNIRNNHKQYAFFWFTMASALAIIFGLRFVFIKRD